VPAAVPADDFDYQLLPSRGSVDVALASKELWNTKEEQI
jgi:hypothetical protein